MQPCSSIEGLVMFLAHEKSIITDFDASNLELCAVNQEAAHLPTRSCC